MSEKSDSKPSSSKADDLPLLTHSGYHALYARHGFTQSERSTRQLLNAAMLEVSERLTRQAILLAEHDGHTTLNGVHAKKAIQLTPEVPAGHYGAL